MPRASVIVPVHNRAALTRRCLDAVLAGGVGDAEVIVVDDGSGDETSAVLASYGDAVRVVVRGENGGFAAACDGGAAVARGEFLVLLNNDTIPRPGWLDALVAYADARPEAAVVGARLLWPNDTVQHAGLVFDHARDPRALYSGFPAGHPAVERARRLQAVTGACMLVRRAAFEAVGGFDADYVNGYEDVDLCLRLGERGGEVHYCPGCVAEHLESATRGYDGPHDAANRARYRARWADVVRPDDLAHYIDDGLVEVRYDRNRIRFTVSPLLGTAHVSLDGDGDRLEGLLALRSRQVFDLLRENIRLSLDAG